MIACTPASNRAVLLLVVEEERTVRKPADKVIAPILLDNPVLSHVDVIPKTRLLYQFYCINKPLYSLSRCRVEMSSIRQTYGLTASASSSNLLSHKSKLKLCNNVRNKSYELSEKRGKQNCQEHYKDHSYDSSHNCNNVLSD